MRSGFRIEMAHGRPLLCGGIIPPEMVKPGQVWASADGSNRTVEVMETPGDWVKYGWHEEDKFFTHTKLNFAFQCRYCLVTPTIPEGLE